MVCLVRNHKIKETTIRIEMDPWVVLNSALDNAHLLLKESETSVSLPRLQRLLFTGPPGSGKTTRIKQHVVDIRRLSLVRPETLDLLVGSDRMVQLITEKANGKDVVVLMIEHVDVLYPPSSSSGGLEGDNAGMPPTDRDALVTLVSCLRRVPVGTVVVLTARSSAGVHPLLRGVIDIEAVMPYPTLEERIELLREGKKRDDDHTEDASEERKVLQRVAGRTGGLSHGEVAALARRKNLASFSGGGISTQQTTEVPEVRWSEVIGLEEAKASLQGLAKVGRHVLLYGVPGTGKTLLAKAVATELHATFLHASLASIVTAAVGQSERNLP